MCLRKNYDIKTVQLMLVDNNPYMVLRTYANINKSDIIKGSKDFFEYVDKILE